MSACGGSSGVHMCMCMACIPRTLNGQSVDNAPSPVPPQRRSSLGAPGVDFGLLADVCVGHNAYDVTLDAYFDQAAWAALPALPPRALRGAGRLVKLVASEEGVLRAAALPPAGLESLVRWGPEPSE